MVITRLIIEGFKGFKDRFCIEFNESVNIIVGDNEAGKSTILEAINLGLTGLYAGSRSRTTSANIYLMIN